MVERVTEFKVLDTHTGPVSLMPGDFILQDFDGGEPIGVRARDLGYRFVPISPEAAAVMRLAADDTKQANHVGYQQDLVALEEQFHRMGVSSAEPLVELVGQRGPTMLGLPIEHVPQTQGERLPPDIQYAQDLGVQPAGELHPHEDDGLPAMTLVDDQPTDPAEPIKQTVREITRWHEDGGPERRGQGDKDAA
jgi:hypothetical protein